MHSYARVRLVRFACKLECMRSSRFGLGIFSLNPVKGSTAVVKGRIEEAADALTGNDKLRAKGQVHQDYLASMR